MTVRGRRMQSKTLSLITLRSENRGAGVPPAVARAFLRSAQDRLCPRAGAGRSRDRGRDARATSLRPRAIFMVSGCCERNERLLRKGSKGRHCTRSSMVEDRGKKRKPTAICLLPWAERESGTIVLLNPARVLPCKTIPTACTAIRPAAPIAIATSIPIATAIES